MQRDSSSAGAYRADVEGDQREVLEALRAVILEIVPEAEEGVRYGMLDYPGLANLAAQKHYVSLYVAASVLAKWKGRFPGVSAGKSCLRFTRIDQVDPGTLRELLQEVREFRLREEED